MSAPGGEGRWAAERVDSGRPAPDVQLERIASYVRGFHAVHLMDVGVALGLFARLAASQSGLTPEQLAASLGLQPGPVAVWCETACALELLDYEPGDGYRMAPHMGGLLGSRDGLLDLGAVPRAHLAMASGYSAYPALFAGETLPHPPQDDAGLLLALGAALRSLPRVFLELIVPALPRFRSRLEAASSLLDVGCGAGEALVAFARHVPRLRATGIDIAAPLVEAARTAIDGAGVSARAEVLQADATRMPVRLAGRFDIVASLLTLHEVAPQLKDAAVAGMAGALRPGGCLLLVEEGYPGGPSELRQSGRRDAVLTQWYELGWGSELDAREEIRGRLERHGLEIEEETDAGRFWVATATRPSGPK